MIRGAQRLLRTPGYLSSDFSDDGTYEGQSSLSEFAAFLPDFRVLELGIMFSLKGKGLAR